MADFTIDAELVPLQPSPPAITVAAVVSQTQRDVRRRSTGLSLLLAIPGAAFLVAIAGSILATRQGRPAQGVYVFDPESQGGPPPAGLLPRWRRPFRDLPE